MFEVARHEVVVGYAGIEVNERNVLGGMKGVNLSVGGGGNSLGDILSREFERENSFNIILLNEVDELSDAASRSFGLFGTTRKGGIVTEAVGLNEIIERKAVGDDERLCGLSGEGLEIAIELSELSGVVGTILGEKLGIVGIECGELLLEVDDDLNSVSGASPIMFVVVGVSFGCVGISAGVENVLLVFEKRCDGIGHAE